MLLNTSDKYCIVLLYLVSEFIFIDIFRQSFFLNITSYDLVTEPKSATPGCSSSGSATILPFFISLNHIYDKIIAFTYKYT